MDIEGRKTSPTRGRRTKSSRQKDFQRHRMGEGREEVIVLEAVAEHEIKFVAGCFGEAGNLATGSAPGLAFGPGSGFGAVVLESRL